MFRLSEALGQPIQVAATIGSSFDRPYCLRVSFTLLALPPCRCNVYLGLFAVDSACGHPTVGTASTGAICQFGTTLAIPLRLVRVLRIHVGSPTYLFIVETPTLPLDSTFLRTPSPQWVTPLGIRPTLEV